jgi:hypothetical protein
MAIEYTNRRGKKYYLHEGKTKTGKPKYFFSMKPEGNPINTIPPGYEIYENPNAQVFLRKPPLQIVTPSEIEIVREGVKKYAEAKYFLVDVKDKHIIVYQCFSYTPMMQFVLNNAETREFTVQRWCFRGSVDGWISLDRSPNLSELVKTYGSHLGKESFYDLTPYG